MENELQPTEEVIPPVDLTGLETKLTELVEVMEKEQEIKLEEKALEEEQALLEEQQAVKDEELAKENETTFQTMQTNLQTSSDTQTLILEEMQTMNANFIVLHDKTDQQNDLIIESSFTITLAIVIVVSIKVFIDQISKW